MREHAHIFTGSTSQQDPIARGQPDHIGSEQTDSLRSGSQLWIGRLWKRAELEYPNTFRISHARVCSERALAIIERPTGCHSLTFKRFDPFNGCMLDCSVQAN